MALGYKYEKYSLKCPFCKNKSIKVHEKRAKLWGSGDPKNYGIEIKVKKCPECGEKKSKIKRKLEKKGYNMK